jgi:hypothetical protein
LKIIVASTPSTHRLVSALFRESLNVIDSTLMNLYGVPREDAKRLEEELLNWFDRFARRPGTSESIKNLRPHLISMACKIGHIYWFGKPANEQPQDENAKRSLALGPEIIAIEIEGRLGEGVQSPSEER